MSTPTPRTDEARRIDNGDTRPLLDEMETLERELAAERETSRLLRVAMDARDEGYTQSRRRMSALESELTAKGQAVRNLAEVISGQDKELATERARLDYLSTRGFEHRHHETGDHLGYEWTISSYSESEDVTLRDVIDAEMREEAK